MSDTHTALIAIDWGSSALRGARLNAAGVVLEEAAFPHGILSVTPGDFARVFNACFGAWQAHSNALCLISGMAGSRQGWSEAPYCPCPAGFDALVAHLHWLRPGRLAIVPGLCTEQGNTPDVMRGEEVQVMGAMVLTGQADGCFVLPGTHSKWVTVAQQRVTGFQTFMTGEFYAWLSQHSLLARSVDAAAPFDGPAFDRGVDAALAGSSLLHTAFGTRTLSLFDRMGAAALASYLSGLVIGDELRARPATGATHVCLIGAGALTERYERALARCGLGSSRLGAEATWAGHHAIAKHLSH